MTNQTTPTKDAYLDRRPVEEDEEELMRTQRMAANGYDRLIDILADCIIMTASLPDIRAAFADNAEEKRVYDRHVPVACYDEDDNYARDIEKFEHDMTARGWILEDEDYDYKWDDYDYE